MKMTYETHYKSTRPDGRHTATMAAFMERLRQTERQLAFPKGATKEEFTAWKAALKDKVLELLHLPEFSEQPSPQKLDTVARDGYRVEKWEFYPDDYTAVPFLVLIPDAATAQNPAPGVLCFPGSTHSKEFFSDEPLLDSPKCRFQTYPERNRMGRYVAENGMVAFVFDNPATAECALDIDSENDYGSRGRRQLCYGLIQNGESYFGLSLFQKLCFMRYIKDFPYVDQSRLAVCAHSLGCDDAMYLALLCDEIGVVVFNDFVGEERHRYMSATEYDENAMCNDIGVWHIVPGMFRYYARVDILAALAPKKLALNEGGAEYYLDMIREAYALNEASENLQITHYPKYQEADSRCKTYEPPKYGLSQASYFEYSNVDAPDHSFRREPSIPFLQKHLFK